MLAVLHPQGTPGVPGRPPFLHPRLPCQHYRDAMHPAYADLLRTVLFLRPLQQPGKPDVAGLTGLAQTLPAQ